MREFTGNSPDDSFPATGNSESEYVDRRKNQNGREKRNEKKKRRNSCSYSSRSSNNRRMRVLEEATYIELQHEVEASTYNSSTMRTNLSHYNFSPFFYFFIINFNLRSLKLEEGNSVRL